MAAPLAIANTSHVAGHALKVDVLTGFVMRQRCAWCGCVLFEHHVNHGGALRGRPWIAGRWVQMDGGDTVVGYTTTTLIAGPPPNACMSQELAIAPAEERRVEGRPN